MAEFEVRTNQLKKNADSENTISGSIISLSQEIRSVAQKIRLGSASETAVRSSLRALAEENDRNGEKMKTLSASLDSIASYYEQAEQRIQETEISGANASEGKSDSDSGTPEKFSILPLIVIGPVRPIWTIPWTIPTGPAVEIKRITQEIKRLLQDSDIGGSLEGDVLDGSVKGKLVTKWDTEKKDAKLAASVEAEGHLAKGTAKGNVGNASGKVSATIGSVGATGTIGATLFKDGKLSPAIDGKLKAEAAAVKGSAEGQIGNDENNVHVKGSGKLLGAEAEASGSAGVITYTDKTTGQTKTEYGAKGKVGAEAYVAEGKISGGFTLFGIKVDAGVSGKAGGAGISAEGRVTTGGVSGEIGAGLGLGAGLEISIDWSGFKLW
jgi:hypothetical protein